MLSDMITFRAAMTRPGQMNVPPRPDNPRVDVSAALKQLAAWLRRRAFRPRRTAA